MLKLSDRIWAVMFVAANPLTRTELLQLTGTSVEDLEQSLDELEVKLTTTPLQLLIHHDQYQIVTRPEYAADIARLSQTTEINELTRPALEVLAIVAYRGPLTRTELEAIRGVGSEVSLRQLLQRGLIAEFDRSTAPGKPTRYHVTATFLRNAGLAKLSDLPPLPIEPAKVPNET